MKRMLKHFAVVLLAVATMASCSDEGDACPVVADCIVGTWNVTTDEAGITNTGTVTFNADGTASTTGDAFDGDAFFGLDITDFTYSFTTTSGATTYEFEYEEPNLLISTGGPVISATTDRVVLTGLGFDANLNTFTVTITLTK